MTEPKTTWRLLVPMLVYTAHHGTEPERQGAMDELLKLADIVDTYIAQLTTLRDSLPDETPETAGVIPSSPGFDALGYRVDPVEPDAPSALGASLTQAAAEIDAPPPSPQRDSARAALKEAAGLMQRMGDAPDDAEAYPGQHAWKREGQ